MEQVIQILEKTISPVKEELESALKYLECAASSNLPEYVKVLSDVLAHGGDYKVARMAAGIQLKNTLASNDPRTKDEYRQRWLNIPASVRHYVKENVLAALGTEQSRPSSAAQCVAHIAVTELPVKQWDGLISHLTTSVTAAGATDSIKEATLEAIGYICQDIEGECIAQAESNNILTAIVHGMKKEETNDHVRLAATNALLNSLEFTKENFDKDSERHFIMQVVCEATQSQNIQIKVASLQCLVKIMSLYYQYMEHYMGPALFAITLEAMKSDVDEVALQGIEFWSNVCDEEVDLAIESNEAEEIGRPPERTSRFYAKGALQYLIPVLMTCLTRQEEGGDEDEWIPCKAAGVCLMLFSTCCEDDIIPHVIPFVQAHITSPNWRYRDAAIMAFGSIIDGPEPGALKPLVEQAMPTLIQGLSDDSVAVCDTAAWTLGRICEIIPETACNEVNLKPLLNAFVNSLKGEPRIAANVCWALSSLAEAAYEQALELTDSPGTYCLSPCFDSLVEVLLATTDRADGNQSNLRNAAYEALMELIKNSPNDCYATVQKTTLIILDRLEQVLQMESKVQSMNERVQVNDIASLLCATLQSVLRKVTKDDAPMISDQIMNALLRMFQTAQGKSGGVQEDALLAVSTLVETLGAGFVKYMEAFKPFLISSLRSYETYAICSAAVGVTGDICRGLGPKIQPYASELMQLLVGTLSNNVVDRNIKPSILSVFGDMALALGPNFDVYLDVTMNMLEAATKAHFDRNDYDMVEYVNSLRESCIEAYTGIVQGLKDGPNPKVKLLIPFLNHIIIYITNLAMDDGKSDCLISSCLGLIGDLCSVFGGEMLQHVENDAINNLLRQGKNSKTGRTKSVASWTAKEIKKLKTSTIT